MRHSTADQRTHIPPRLATGLPPLVHHARKGPDERSTARLGHADPAITLRVYAHVIRTAEAAAADIFAQAVSDRETSGPTPC